MSVFPRSVDFIRGAPVADFVQVVHHVKGYSIHGSSSKDHPSTLPQVRTQCISQAEERVRILRIRCNCSHAHIQLE